MSSVKTIDDIDLKGKRVFVRVDFKGVFEFIYNGQELFASWGFNLNDFRY